MSLSLPLTVGIVTDKYLHPYLSSRLWLIIAIIIWSIVACCHVLTEADHHSPLFGKKISRLISCQCLGLHLCIFCIGGLVTSRHIAQQSQPARIVSFQTLSALDRAKIKAHQLQKQLEQQLRTYQVTGQDFAIVSAMSMGDKASLDKATIDAYSVSGASHILAVSGLHIGIIFQLIILLMGGKRRSKLTIVLSIPAIWAYVVFIGLPASAVRAATMLSIYCLGIISLRPDPTLNTLALTYIIMAFINPLQIFDIGFQLSFLAVGSILMFYPLLFDLIQPHHKAVRGIWGMFCVSLAAQLGTFPIVTYYFCRIPCYSLITNFIAIPAATLILYLCVLFFLVSPLTHIACLSAVGTWLTQVVAKALTCVTQFTNDAFLFIGHLPGASIEPVHLNLPQLSLLYVLTWCLFIILTYYYRSIKHCQPPTYASGLPF